GTAPAHRLGRESDPVLLGVESQKQLHHAALEPARGNSRIAGEPRRKNPRLRATPAPVSDRARAGTGDRGRCRPPCAETAEVLPPRPPAARRGTFGSPLRPCRRQGTAQKRPAGADVRRPTRQSVYAA